MKWNNDEIETAIQLIKAGSTYTEIATQLHRSKKSVKEKLNRLKYKESNFNEIRYCEDVVCFHCSKIFKANKHTKRKYCSLSCSASVNGVGKVRHYVNGNKSKKKCLMCDNYTINLKYCSHKCAEDNSWIEKKSDIESGTGATNRVLRKYIIERDGHVCNICKITIWCDLPTVQRNLDKFVHVRHDIL